MKSIAHTTSKITKLILVTALIFSVLFTNVLPANAATLEDVANALRGLQNSLNQYKMAQSGAVLAATITTVSTPAQLTAALNAATGGETILLSAGNYGEFAVNAKSYSSLVTITAANPSNPPTFAKFTVGSVKNLKLDKIYVVFAPTLTSTDVASGMAATNVDNFIISNSVFKSLPNPAGEQIGRGISVTGGTNVTIAGNEVTGSRRGILTGGIDGLAIKHNYVHDIRTSQLSGGIVSNVLIEGNHLRTSRAINFGGDGDHGDFIHYWTQPHQTGPSSNFKIINNFMEQAGGTALLGIYMDNNTNPQGFTNVHIENNILHNSNGQGMRLEDVVGAVVKNNSLIQSEGDFRKAPRIRLEDGTKNVVLENNIVANTTAGGAMDNPTGNNLVERRTFIAQIEDSSKDNYAGKIFMKAPILDGEIEDHAVRAGSIAVGYGATLTRSQILQSQVITSPITDGGTVTPTPTPTTPTLTLTSSASSVTTGGAATLTWSSTNATACTASGAWTGAKTVTGTQSTGALSTVGTQTYTLACTGTGGSVTKSVSVAVTSGSVITPTPTPVPTGLSRVKLTEDKSVRLRPASTVAGTQLMGSEGVTNFAEGVTTSGHTWVNVNFDSGVDGWLPQQYLEVITVPAPTVTLTSSPAVVVTGGSAMLTWSSTNATACTASGAWTGSKSTIGSQATGVLSTAGTQTYTLVCTGMGGSASANVNVVVTAPVVVSPTPATGISIGAIIKTTRDANVRVAAGTDATLVGTVPLGVQGTVLAGPTSMNGFTWWKIDFNHSHPDGWSSDTNFVLVSPAPTPTPIAPTLTFTASPSSLTSGGASTLTWSSTNATSCTASTDWTGAKTISGTQTTGTLTSSKTYTLSCTGTGGTVTKTAMVGVMSVPLPPADTDLDTIADTIDNCVSVSNQNQTNFDRDTQGDACDSDDDNDGIMDTAEYAGCQFNAAATCGASVPNVTTTDVLNVRSTAAGTLLGTQPLGATGVSNSTTQVTLNGTTWIYVNFTTGVDGYVSTTYLTGSGVSTNNQALLDSLLAQLALLQAALAALLAQ